MLTQLIQLQLRHLHQPAHLLPTPLEIIHAKRIDRDHLDAGLVADLEDLGEGLEAQVVAFDSLDAVRFGEASVAVHDEGDVLRDWALAEGAD